MSDEKPVYERDDDTFIFFSIVMVIALCAIPYFVWIDPIAALRHRYVQIPELTLYVFCYSAIVGFWAYYYFREPLTIYHDRLEIKRRRSGIQTYYFADLSGWKKVNSWRTFNPYVTAICLSFSGQIITISESLKPFEHLDELAEYFEKRGFAETNLAPGDDHDMYLGAFYLVLYSLVFFIMAYEPAALNKGTDTQIMKSVVLNGKPWITEYTTGKSHTIRHKMSLKIKEANDFTFTIKNEHAISEYRDYIKHDVYAHDTINIEILKYDYDVKIAHSREPSFWDKHYNWECIKMQKVEFPYLHIEIDSD